MLSYCSCHDCKSENLPEYKVDALWWECFLGNIYIHVYYAQSLIYLTFEQIPKETMRWKARRHFREWDQESVQQKESMNGVKIWNWSEKMKYRTRKKRESLLMQETWEGTVEKTEKWLWQKKKKRHLELFRGFPRSLHLFKKSLVSLDENHNPSHGPTKANGNFQVAKRGFHHLLSSNLSAFSFHSITI